MLLLSHPRLLVLFLLLLLAGCTVLALMAALDAAHLHQLAVNPAIMSPHG